MTDSLIRVRVAAKHEAAEGICALTLTAATGGPLPAFEAGAHVDLHLPGFVRQYSLCGDPLDVQQYALGVLQDPASRGGSVAVHALQAGDELQISPPRSLFSLEDDASAPALLLAGGIGVTPLIAMAHTLHRRGQPFALHYCTRSVARTAFASQLRSAAFAQQVHFHHDEPGGTPFDVAATLAAQAPGAHLYACGPAGFLDHVLASARAAGWPEARVHFERFAAPVVATDNDAAFEVRLASSGRTFVVPAGIPISQVLLAEGVDVPLSCEQGVCGTCLTRVLAGTPDHRDAYLTDEERACNDQMLVCCSRAAAGSCLTLDL